jgi:hypothetical protein
LLEVQFKKYGTVTEETLASGVASLSIIFGQEPERPKAWPLRIIKQHKFSFCEFLMLV